MTTKQRIKGGWTAKPKTARSSTKPAKQSHRQARAAEAKRRRDAASE